MLRARLDFEPGRVGHKETEAMTKRRIVHQGPHAVVEEIDSDGEHAWYVRCSDPKLNGGFDVEAAALAYAKSVEDGAPEPPI